MQPSALPLFVPVGILVNDFVGLILSLFQPPSLESVLWKNTVLLPGCPSFLILVRAMQQELGSVPPNSGVSTHPMPVEELFSSLQGMNCRGEATGAPSVALLKDRYHAI